jgi:conjugal transfer pilus assembly protein TraA
MKTSLQTPSRLTMGLLLATVALALMSLSTMSQAGTSGEEFKGLFDMLTGWMNGYLARSVALAASIAGALYGLAKQNPLLATVGIVFAVILSVGPAVINGILSAVV